jgi:nitrous oxidase accessory protein NosD
MFAMRRAGVRRLSTVLAAVAALAAAGIVASPAAGAALPPCRVRNATQGTSFATVAGLALTRAIARANPGDRLDVRGKCVGSFTIDKSLDLYGNPNKDDSTVLDGGRAGRVVVVDPVAVVRMTDLIITRGYLGAGQGAGAGITNVGELTLIRSYVFDNHSAGSGGGILNVGDLTVTRSGVRFNSAGFDGGGMFNAGGGRGIITYRSTIADNTSVLGGAGIFSENQLEMHNSLVTRNVTEGNGGGILSVAGLVLDNTAVVGNVPDDCDC